MRTDSHHLLVNMRHSHDTLQNGVTRSSNWISLKLGKPLPGCALEEDFYCFAFEPPLITTLLQLHLLAKEYITTTPFLLDISTMAPATQF